MTTKAKKLAAIGAAQVEELTSKPKPITPYARLKAQYDQLNEKLTNALLEVDELVEQKNIFARRNEASTTALDVANLLLRNETTKREVIEGRIDSIRPYLNMAVHSPFLKMLFPKYAEAIRSLYKWWTTSRLEFYKSSDETTHDFVEQMVSIGQRKHPGLEADLAVLSKDIPAGNIAGLRNTTPQQVPGKFNPHAKKS